MSQSKNDFIPLNKLNRLKREIGSSHERFCSVCNRIKREEDKELLEDLYDWWFFDKK